MKIGSQQVLTVVVLLLAASFVNGQRGHQDQPLTDELYKLVEERTESIRNGILDSDNEWAGIYLAGDHHPTVLMWAPKEGFLVTSSHHTFSPSWVNYGSVSLGDTFLSLRPELPKENKYAHIIDTQFRLVRWGQQHFLISPDELERFAYAVHARAESEIVQYFARSDNGERRRSGFPNLPAE